MKLNPSKIVLVFYGAVSRLHWIFRTHRETEWKCAPMKCGIVNTSLCLFIFVHVSRSLYVEKPAKEIVVIIHNKN